MGQHSETKLADPLQLCQQVLRPPNLGPSCHSSDRESVSKPRSGFRSHQCSEVVALVLQNRIYETVPTRSSPGPPLAGDQLRLLWELARSESLAEAAIQRIVG